MENANYDVFDAIMAKDWLNALISNKEQRKSLGEFNSQIELIPEPDYIHVSSGIEILADVLGEELKEKDRKDEFREYFFIYRDVKVAQLSTERLGKYAGAD